MNETSAPSATAPDLNTSSPTCNSSFPESKPSLVQQLNTTPLTAEEAPLLAMTEKPLHLMTDDELRTHVARWRARRANTPTLKNELLAEAEEEAAVDEGRKPKRDKLKDFLDQF
jgi:hypothetical protein